MPASPADSALYRGLFSDEATAALFTDSAEIRAMLIVEGALARVQGEMGLIPMEAAAFIDRSSREVMIDPAGLARETATNGVPVPALVSAFRKAMEAPDYAQYLHWGATSQDIMDTALALRLRRLVQIWDEKLGALIAGLAALAETHAETPMAARTYGQVATPTSFGAVVAGWGRPMIRHRKRLADLAPELATVSLGGAAGTLSAMGPEGPAVRAALAKVLNLRDPEASWHAERDHIATFAGLMAGIATSLGKMGDDLILMTQSGISEVAISGAGGSSTMPHKQNPVGPSVLVAIGRQAVALNSAIQGAAIHRQQRDGAAWFIEWMSLGQLIQLTGRAIALAVDLSSRITPRPDAMAANLDDGTGLIHAEAASFALARHMPRPEAQAKVKALCAEARIGQSLFDLIKRDFPELALDVTASLGTAPAEARAFAKSAR